MALRSRTAPIVAAAVALLFAFFGGSALSSIGGESGDTATASVKRCDEVSVGFTDANVRAKRVKCDRARSVFRNWLRKADDACELGVCPVIKVKRFTCRHGSGDHIIKVRCARPVKKVVVARWGD